MRVKKESYRFTKVMWFMYKDILESLALWYGYTIIQCHLVGHVVSIRFLMMGEQEMEPWWCLSHPCLVAQESKMEGYSPPPDSYSDTNQSSVMCEIVYVEEGRYHLCYTAPTSCVSAQKAHWMDLIPMCTLWMSRVTLTQVCFCKSSMIWSRIFKCKSIELKYRSKQSPLSDELAMLPTALSYHTQGNFIL